MLHYSYSCLPTLAHCESFSFRVIIFALGRSPPFTDPLLWPRDALPYSRPTSLSTGPSHSRPPTALLLITRACSPSPCTHPSQATTPWPLQSSGRPCKVAGCGDHAALGNYGFCGLHRNAPPRHSASTASEKAAPHKGKTVPDKMDRPRRRATEPGCENDAAIAQAVAAQLNGKEKRTAQPPTVEKKVQNNAKETGRPRRSAAQMSGCENDVAIAQAVLPATVHSHHALPSLQ